MEILMILTLLLLVILIVAGVPIAFSFFGVTVFLIVVLNYDPIFLIPYGFSQIDSMALLAIPLFIMAGKVMEYGGIGKVIIDLSEEILEKVRGGLGAVTVVACSIFGAISGSAMATLSTIGSIMTQKLIDKGYPRGYVATLTSHASILGLLIPPSGIMILYGWLSNQSVLAAFLAAAVPGLILAFFMIVINFIYAKKFKLKMSEPSETTEEITFIHKTKKIGIKSWMALPGLVMPVIILGGIYSGIMTVTEAAAVAAIYALPVGMFIYKKMKFSDLKTVFLDAASTTGIIMIMSFAIMIISRIYTTENVPDMITDFLFSITENKYILLIMINIFMIIIGMIMDDVSGVLLSTPILLPVIIGLGIDPIHFAAILAVNLGMGNITPPTAPLLYFGGQLSKAPINEMMGSTIVFLLFAWLPTLVIVTYIPEISLFLPELILGY